ncbi:coiled-coil_56 domain-containing protein [Trichonephila clavipes]|uniref:Cytochrome c oxidase assembly factor 3 n=2 Tax=Trichonephila TaxID=2585208 RepID=A0A8X6KH37_TRICU|nr:coiled-coil_56 domain-containing protein [Trichonephila clavata]GFX87973.1 coiled-coil_56 domain-containing protein [Trichonephila clavipes]
MKNANETVPPNLSSTLQDAQIMYMKRIEKENMERVMRLKRIRRNNIITGFGLAGAVLGTYLYSIFTVKQENFLDELDEKENS